MKWSVCFLCTLLLFLLYGCFAPVNSVYDNARLLDRKESRIGINYSRYYGSDFDLTDEDNEGLLNLNNNYGFSIGYGLSENFNLSFRYEYLKIKNEIEIFDMSFDNFLNYFELGCKINLIKERLALGLPVGLYNYEGGLTASIDPRIFFTVGRSDKFDFTVIPKVHVLIGDDVGLYPGLSLGMGLSSNLDRWAIRPEIGYDGYFNFGVGTYYHFGKNR